MKKMFGILLTLIIILLLFFTLKDINFHEITSLLKGINLFYFALAFVLSAGMFLLWNLRWQYTMKGFVDVSYWFLLKTLIAGIFVNTITPGTGIGGEPARAYFLSKKYKKPKTKFLGYILADKSFNLVIYSVFVIFSILFVFPFLNVPFKSKLVLEILLIALFLLVLVGILIWKKASFQISWIAKKLYRVKFIKKRFKTYGHFERYLSRKIKNFTSVFKKVFTNKKKIYKGLLMSLGFWILNYLTSYFLFIAFNTKISFFPVVVVVTLGYLVGDLSPAPGGIGLMESTMILLYSAMGVAAPLAAVVALLSRVIYYFYSLLIGGISLAYLKFTIE